MKSFTLECENCGADTKVKADNEEDLATWYHLQKKKKKAILCKSCRKKQ